MIAIYLNTIREWGGVDVLAARFATFLREAGEPFFIVEPEGGRIRKELPWATFHAPDSLSAVEEPDHVLVTSLPKLVHDQFPWGVFRGSKILAWAVHPLDPFRKFFPYSGKLLDHLGFPAVRAVQWCLPSHNRLVRRFFSSLIGGNGLCAMDGANLRALCHFYPGIASSVPIIPVPSPLSFSGESKATSEALSVSYFGRLDRFKWSALSSFIDGSLGPRAKMQPVSLHCIGDGPCMPDLESACARFGVGLVKHGFMPNYDAIKCVATYSDIAVAMGTAALDAAGTGHPCIIIDPALGPFRKSQRLFRFVDETPDFTVGEYRDAPGYVHGLRSFDECVEPAMIARHREAARDYVGSRHAPDACFGGLLAMLMNSQVRGEDLADNARGIMASFHAPDEKKVARR
ncbi:hypothetical protein [Arenimonas sp. MALMAid1274]|uniref:hypothetical protein n=1 Tax=Arenimonas sp. MALMAid1274 TaxID=3411630 RepID=UPI003B9E103A